MNLDVGKYSIEELEDILRLTKPYKFEDVSIRIEDYKASLVNRGVENNAEFVLFLSNVSQRFLVNLGAQQRDIAATHPVMNPKMYNPNASHTTSRIVNVDSRYRENIFDGGSPTDYTFNVAEPLIDVKSIRLYAVHIPTTWHTFSKKYGNTRMYVDDVAVDIPDGNYTPKTLVAAAKDVISNQLRTVKMDWDPVDFKTTVSSEANSSKTLTFYSEPGSTGTKDFTIGTGERTKINNSLGWALGYRGPGPVVHTTINPTDGQITFAAAVDCYGPRYFYLIMDDFTNSQLSRGSVNISDFRGDDEDTVPGDRWKHDRVRPPSNTNVLAIISIEQLDHAERGIVPFINSGLEFNIRNYSSPVNIKRMQITLVDDRGNTVDLNGADWSFAMIVEHQL